MGNGLIIASRALNPDKSLFKVHEGLSKSNWLSGFMKLGGCEEPDLDVEVDTEATVEAGDGSGVGVFARVSW